MSNDAVVSKLMADLLVRVYEIHERIIARTGGIEGLRDAASLHSAVARPFSTFAGEELYPDDFDKAAALFHSLIKSHPFMDATKRTAFASTLYFLEVYGHPRPGSLPEEEVIAFCLAVAEENARQSHGQSVPSITIPEIAAWFRRLIAPHDPT
ncbi:MAG TPA: type II toxin-antitoxin system death-on-curing family toxin [Roseiflexaceae bacterium]|nr:type II toxin-antitoxin system death-on-curing family toxin [Roseiflexaceae bacterium]